MSDNIDFTGVTYFNHQKSEADTIAEQTEGVLAELREKRTGLFTVGELMWLIHRSNKLRWSTTAEQEQRLLDSALGLKKTIEERESA